MIGDSDEWQDVHRRQWSFFSHAGEISSLSPREKRTPRKSEHVLGIQATNGITFSTLQQEVHIQDFGFIWLKILRQPYRWGGSATILVLPIRGRQEALPHCPKEQRVIVCGIENFVFVVAVMRQHILTSKVS